MKRGMIAVLMLAAAPVFGPSALADGPAKGGKKVLVELYTSQGCNSCPSANDLLGQIAATGPGAGAIVPIAFHVDYFNTPWADPFSSAEFSKREMAYNSVLKRKDLYFTPMMMVDGRSPMLGSNRSEALKAIRRSLAERPGVSIELDLSGPDSGRTAKVRVRPTGAEVVGRPLMVGLALTEGPITTKVPSGENAGSNLVEPAVVRSFAFEKANLDVAKARDFSFPIRLKPDSVAGRCRVVAFVQDWDDGRVHQAESTPWETPKAAR